MLYSHLKNIKLTFLLESYVAQISDIKLIIYGHMQHINEVL